MLTWNVKVQFFAVFKSILTKLQLWRTTASFTTATSSYIRQNVSNSWYLKLQAIDYTCKFLYRYFIDFTNRILIGSKQHLVFDQNCILLNIRASSKEKVNYLKYGCCILPSVVFHCRLGWCGYCNARYDTKRSTSKFNTLHPDADCGLLLAFLAVLLHGPNEPINWAKTEATRHCNDCQVVGQQTRRGINVAQLPVV